MKRYTIYQSHSTLTTTEVGHAVYNDLTSHIADEIKMAKDKALQIDRNEILSADRSQKNSESTENKQLTFLINRDGFMCGEIKKIVKNNQLIQIKLQFIQR